jgi:5-methylcytosine-specific restriction protein A
MKVYQRRPASIIVSSQYLYSREQNRVLAWHPDFGFPEPADNRERQQRPPGLVVCLARTDNGEVWAGWFLNDSSESWPVADSDARDALMPMLSRSNLGSDGAAGFIDLSRAGVQIDELNYVAPFRASQGLPGRIAPSVGQGTEFVPSSDPLEASERAFAEAYLDQDEVPAVTDEERVYYSRVRRRNQRAARALKSLYSEECQITGDAYTFEKRDGTRYVEVHHLVPLGEGGADDPRNMIVTSALTHRQLHYANVEGVDLSRISTRPDGWGELPVTINGEPALIVWHPLHAQLIEANEEPDGV